MRLQSALLFGAALVGVQAHLAPQPAVTATTLQKRQDTGGDDDADTTTDPPAEETSEDPSSSEDETTSDPPEETSSSDGGDDEEDTTVFRTETVTDGDADTITQRTTVRRTSTFTVVVISTEFSTSTVTEDGDTATRTIWETSTVIDNDNAKRDLGLRTLPIAVAAFPTEAPVPTVTAVDWTNLDMARRKMQRDNVFDKRATVTEVRTVTVGDDSETTVVDTITQTVVTTRSTVTTTTNVVTETEIQDASTTETVTSTLTVTSTAVSTGAQTTTGTSDGGGNSDSSSSSDDGGLSTGAKAGIGAGVGVGALLIIGALAFFCIRRRRRGPKADPDAMAGASEVPVGPGPAGGSAPMSQPNSSHHAAAAGLLSPQGRPIPSKPSPEGYRGTAMGDGRAGYAKPAPYGSAYAQQPSATTSPTNRSSTLNSTSPFSPAGQTVSSMGADSLPAHPVPGDQPAHGGAAELGNDAAASRWQPAGGATEMDAAGVGHQSSAMPQNVYEMPAQNYR